jgi:hypothetical protein
VVAQGFYFLLVPCGGFLALFLVLFDFWNRLLRVWFLDDDTKMTPNLFYGQIDPKKTAP